MAVFGAHNEDRTRNLPLTRARDNHFTMCAFGWLGRDRTDDTRATTVRITAILQAIKKAPFGARCCDVRLIYSNTNKNPVVASIILLLLFVEFDHIVIIAHSIITRFHAVLAIRIVFVAICLLFDAQRAGKHLTRPYGIEFAIHLPPNETVRENRAGNECSDYD